MNNRYLLNELWEYCNVAGIGSERAEWLCGLGGHTELTAEENKQVEEEVMKCRDILKQRTSSAISSAAAR